MHVIIRLANYERNSKMKMPIPVHAEPHVTALARPAISGLMPGSIIFNIGKTFQCFLKILDHQLSYLLSLLHFYSC